MSLAADPLLAIRADLATRLERLAVDLPGLNQGQVASAVYGIRQTARGYGLGPLAELASAFESALSGRCSLLLSRQWLDMMQEAVGCTALSPNASKTWLAALGVRFPA